MVKRWSSDGYGRFAVWVLDGSIIFPSFLLLDFVRGLIREG